MNYYKFHIFLITYFLISTSHAQTPIDSIRQDVSNTNDFYFSIQPNYQPNSYYTYSADSQGNLIQESVNIQNLSINFSGKYTLNENITLSGIVTPSLIIYNKSSIIQSDRDFNANLSGGLGLTYKDFESMFSPSYSLRLSYPLNANLSISGNYIRDPLAISMYTGYNIPEKYQNSSILVGSSINFIANDSISLSASLNHTIPLSSIKIQTTSLDFSTNFSLDGESKQSLQLSTQIYFSNNTASNSFSVSYQLKNPF